MIILIPLGGIGKRFSDFGYSDPKPLIKVNGKEIIFWVLENLKIRPKDKIYIAYNPLLEQYNFEKIISNRDKRVNFFKLPKNTNGPVQTVDYFLNEISSYKEKILLIDGDTFYQKDIIKTFYKKKNSAILSFKDNNINPIYSYIKIKNKLVSEIAEKKKISENANTGAYFFSSVNILQIYIKRALKKYSSKSYISDVYKEMIKDKIKIEALKISINDFKCLGTPEQVRNFSLNSKPELKRFCFDLDNTLVTFPRIKGDYSTVAPIHENIKFLQMLKSKGHHIIIYTARRMKTHNSNVSKVIKEIKNLTVKQLKNFKIYYDELIFGKPFADFYIDDLSINSLEDLNFKLGYYYEGEKTRVFNNVEVGENFTVKKSTNTKKLNSEINYYKNIPNKIKKYFPAILDYRKNSYKMETIRGTSFEYLLNNNLLEKSHLDLLFSALNEIHEIKLNFNNKEALYKNYFSKTKERIKFIKPDLIKKNNTFFNKVLFQIKNYEINDYGKLSIIHGDTVFSNIIKTHTNKIKFVDPRGEYSSKASIHGDMFYDYAKVFQSLNGYHDIINNKIFNPNNKQIMELVNYYNEYIIEKFGEKKLDIIKVLSSSFYISLIPFHAQEYQVKFINIAKKIFNSSKFDSFI